MRAGHVTTEHVGPIIAQLVRERWPQGDGCDVLAEKVGCHRDTIDGIVRGDTGEIAFDLADSLLTALGRWDYWHGELADIYPTKFMETCAVPSCGKMFPESQVAGKVKRTCSPRCGFLYAQVKSGRCTGQRMRARDRCLKGHKLEGENVYVSPKSGKRVCVACRREKQREWQQSRDRTEYDRRYRAKRAAARAN